MCWYSYRALISWKLGKYKVTIEFCEIRKELIIHSKEDCNQNKKKKWCIIDRNKAQWFVKKIMNGRGWYHTLFVEVTMKKRREERKRWETDASPKVPFRISSSHQIFNCVFCYTKRSITSGLENHWIDAAGTCCKEPITAKDINSIYHGGLPPARFQRLASCTIDTSWPNLSAYRIKVICDQLSYTTIMMFGGGVFKSMWRVCGKN